MADVILKEVGAILENAEQSGLALTKNEILSLKVFHHVLQVSGLVPPPPPSSTHHCTLHKLLSCCVCIVHIVVLCSIKLAYSGMTDCLICTQKTSDMCL